MKKHIFFLGILLITAFTIQAENINFTANSPSTVANFSQFRVVFSVNSDAKDFRIGEIENFDVLMGPSTSRSQNFQIINGKTQSSVSTSFTFVLQAKKEGTYTIPAATVIVDNQKIESNSLTIKVLPTDQQASQQSSSGQDASNKTDEADVFVRAIASKTDVFEQEGVLLTYKLYVRGVNFAGFSDIKFPEAKGFLSQEIELPEDKQWSLENYNDKNYNTVILKQTLLYPQQSGKLRIESGKFDAILRMTNAASSRRSIFDDFFQTYQDVKKTLTSSPINIYVKDLPSGKPKSYANAVGDFSMKSSINTSNLKVNEAVTIKLVISGNGNLKLIKNPEVKFPADFDVYDPKIETKLKNNISGVSGTKTIEYLAIPRYAGLFTIPSIEFGYFDTRTDSYKTIKTSPYEITVEKGVGANAENVVGNYVNKESLKFLGSDIRYINTKDLDLYPKRDFFYGSIAFALSYIFPFLIAIILFFIYRKQAKENANRAMVRTKRANKVAIKRLKIAQKYLHEGEKEKFYDEILKSIWGYFSDKLNIPIADLTKDKIEEELLSRGIEETLINEFKAILSTCEYARYSPAEGTNEMDQLYQTTIDKIIELEEKIKK